MDRGWGVGRVWLASQKVGGGNGVWIGGCAEARPAAMTCVRSLGRLKAGRDFSLGMSAFLKRSERKNDSSGNDSPMIMHAESVPECVA